MIVREEWYGEGNETAYYEPAAPRRGEAAWSLASYRNVPHDLWAEYVAATALVQRLTARIAGSPWLPEYAAYIEQREREHEADEKRRWASNRQAAEDGLLQEQLRVAGLLKPLPLDCPDDEPVRIGDPRGQKIV